MPTVGFTLGTGWSTDRSIKLATAAAQPGALGKVRLDYSDEP
jgi:hypothetical protein